MNAIFIPEFASWESTLRCSMECEHCGLGAGPFSGGIRGGELNTCEAVEMFSDLASLGVKKFIASGGEFTARNDWKILLIELLKRFDMVRQITNGWMGSAMLRNIEKIPGCERMVLSVSVDGLQFTHDANRRTGSFEKVSEIFSDNSPIHRTAITTVMKKNFNELEDIFLWLYQIGVPVWSIQLGLPEGRMPESEFIGIDRMKILTDKISNWQRRALGVMEIIPDDCFGYCHPMRDMYPWCGCQAGKNLITILSNGDITGCPTTFYAPCGNIREYTIHEIWNGSKMEKFRSEIPVCDSCINEKCLGGCRAVERCFGKQFCFT